MQASLLCSYLVAKVTNLRITDSVTLPSPVDLCEEISRNADQKNLVRRTREELHGLIHGDDKRLIAVVGPCSIHDLKACREYAERFAKLAEEVKDRVLMIMRVYFEKPRTTVGWKGLIMDPQLNGTCDIPKGLRIARTFLGEVLDLGIPTATEFLDPITPQYLADSLCWAAIGARTSESQTHRQMASGLSMPVGFKNATSGDLKAAVNGIIAATKRSELGVLDQEGSYENFIQTDASINRGNSGGALLDTKGRLIGINTAIISQTGSSIGIGLAIPVNMVRKVLTDLVEKGGVMRGFLGVELQASSSGELGAIVGAVVPGSAADLAGIKSGDRIIKVGEKFVDSVNQSR